MVCSFCGRSEEQVRIVQGPGGQLCICEECVAVCVYALVKDCRSLALPNGVSIHLADGQEG